jgi:hypothetical protein
MPVDPNIPLGITPPPPINALQTLAGVQSYQTNALQQKALGAQIQSNQAQSQAIQQNTDANGNVDWKGATSALAKDPNGGYNILPFAQASQGLQTGQIGLQRAQVGLDSDQLSNAQSHLNWAYQTASAVANNPSATTDDVFKAISQSVKNGQITPQIASQAISDMPPPGAPAGALQRWAANHAAQAAGAAAQLGLAQPSVSTVDTGPAIQQVATDKLTGTPTITGTFNKGLSPETASTPTPSFDAATNTPVNITRGQFIQQATGGAGQPPPLPSVAMPAGMPSGNGAAGSAVPLPSGPAPGIPGGVRGVPTGPALGVSGSNDGNVATVNTHWSALSNDAANAQTNIGLAQNIKSYASQAATGKQGDKLAAANGLLSVFGVGGQTDLNTATDLLQKNMARLSLSSRSAAGGTDAAGALATAANPHGSMTMTAIKDAADQVIGSQQMALSEQKLLQPYKLQNNVAGYQQAQTAFNQAADPRIWQFQNMDPQQRAQFKAGMSPADQKTFGAKIRTLEGLGAIH